MEIPVQLETQYENGVRYFHYERISIAIYDGGLVVVIIDDFKHPDGRRFEKLIVLFQESPPQKGRPKKKLITKCPVNEGRDYLICTVPNITAKEISSGNTCVPAIEVLAAYEEFINHASRFDWDFFIVFTSHKYLSVSRCIWIMERMRKSLRAAGSQNMYWVAERFNGKEGRHIHLLLDMKGQGADKYVFDLWQGLSGAKKDKTSAVVYIQPYKKELNAGHYLTKEIFTMSDYYDFDFAEVGEQINGGQENLCSALPKE